MVQPLSFNKIKGEIIMIHQSGRHLEEWDGRHWHYTACLNPDTGMTEVSISNENNTIKIGEFSELGSWEYHNLESLSEFLIETLNNKVNNNPIILKMIAKHE